MAAVQNFVKRIEIRLNRSEVPNYLASIDKAPVPQLDGIVTIRPEPRNENDVFPVILKTEEDVVSSRVKGFNCPTCQLTFKYRLHLKHHQSTYQRCAVEYNPEGINVKLDIDQNTSNFNRQVKLKYSCPKCKKEYSQFGDLKRHIASIHSNEWPYVCSTCLHTFKYLHAFFVHSRSEHRFKCENCQLSFVRKPSLEEHAIKCQELMHLSSSIDEATDHWPDVTIKEEPRTEYNLPITIKAGPVYSIDPGVGVYTRKDYQCSTCQLTFKYHLHLRHHQRTNKRCAIRCYQTKDSNFDKNLKTQYTGLDASNSNAPVKHSCSECKKEFTTSEGLRRHVAAHSSEKRPYLCSKCLLAFKFENILNRHTHSFLNKSSNIKATMLKCQPEEIGSMSCDKNGTAVSQLKLKDYSSECKPEFANSANLYSHKSLIHSNECPYVCSTCLYTFKSMDDLNCHTRKEHGFKCESCELAFVSKFNLEEHAIKYHQAVSQECFRCDECKKDFNKYCNLRVHMRVHNNDKPYVCHSCNDTFQHENNLIDHTRKDHRFKCDKCVMCFSFCVSTI